MSREQCIRCEKVVNAHGDANDLAGYFVSSAKAQAALATEEAAGKALAGFGQRELFTLLGGIEVALCDRCREWITTRQRPVLVPASMAEPAPKDGQVVLHEGGEYRYSAALKTWEKVP